MNDFEKESPVEYGHKTGANALFRSNKIFNKIIVYCFVCALF